MVCIGAGYDVVTAYVRQQQHVALLRISNNWRAQATTASKIRTNTLYAIQIDIPRLHRSRLDAVHGGNHVSDASDLSYINYFVIIIVRLHTIPATTVHFILHISLCRKLD